MSFSEIRHFPMPVRQAAVLLAVLLPCSLAAAATYYVDAVQGNDSFQGTRSTPDGSVNGGPWRSLQRVSDAALQPGDQVLLRCGQSWRETLTLMQSGSATAPITVGSNPASCSDKPAIDGGVHVPAASWERDQGSVYKVRLPLSVLSGGELDTTVAGWRIYSDKADARLALATNCPGAVTGCAQITPGVAGPLAISPSFGIVAGQTYKVEVQVYAPRRTRFGVAVRRFTPPYAAQSGYTYAAGNNGWQTVALRFTASSTISDARLDIDLPGRGVTSYLRGARVDLESATTDPVLAAVGKSATLVEAHHPNAGHDSSRPQSVFLSAGVSNYVRGSNGRYGSTYVQTAADLQLPVGASITPGMELTLRSQAWSVKRHQISQVQGTRLFIEPQSEYPLVYAGWGYFVTGARWMLDSPGEWFFDRASNTFYVWMPSGQAPGADVALTVLPLAVLIGDPNRGIFPQHIALQNIAIRNVGEGIRMSRSSNIAMRGMEFSDIASFGVYADGASFMRLESNKFNNTGSDAIHASTATDATIVGNSIANSGVIVDAAGKPLSLPYENYHAIQVGARATITNNVLSNLAYNGILVTENSVVAGNVVNKFSLMLNDSGGLYAGGSEGAVIRNNVVLNGVGNRDGTPTVINTLVSSVYLDGNTGGFTLSGNTFGYADHCVQIHDTFNSTLENNVCYGARRNALRLQETNRNRKTSGDTYGNVIRNNQLFQSTSGAALLQSSKVSDVSHFASFDGNAYSNLDSPIVSYESSPGVSRSFTLAEWQGLAAINGRVIEANGFVGAPLRQYARGLFGQGLLSADQALNAWSRAGGGSPAPSVTVTQGCGPSAVPCVIFNAGGGSATMVSPRFPLIKNKTYHVSFDAKTSDPAQLLKVGVLRAGPTYESLMGLEPFIYSASTTWKRYGFTFKATEDASSARMDFNDIGAGRQVHVSNFEIVPYVDTGVSTSSTLLANTTQVPVSLACPVQATQPQACSRFFSFPDGARINWPLALAVGKSKIVFSQDDSLPDSDGDGVADSQDKCPGSNGSIEVDSVGCGIDQSYGPVSTPNAPGPRR